MDAVDVYSCTLFQALDATNESVSLSIYDAVTVSALGTINSAMRDEFS